MDREKPLISIIVAVARNWAIGLNNELLWHIPEDFKWFKKHTLGCPVIMGRKTFISLPVKPLPQRKNIILTDNPSDCFTGCFCAGTMEEVFEQLSPDQENFIIGGGLVYRQFLPLADKLYLTVIDRDFEADTFFPEPEWLEWKEVFREPHLSDDPNVLGYTFLIFQRRA